MDDTPTETRHNGVCLCTTPPVAMYGVYRWSLFAWTKNVHKKVRTKTNKYIASAIFHYFLATCTPVPLAVAGLPWGLVLEAAEGR